MLEIGFSEDARKLLKALVDSVPVAPATEDLVPWVIDTSDGPRHGFLDSSQQEHWVEHAAVAQSRALGWRRLYVEAGGA